MRIPVGGLMRVGVATGDIAADIIGNSIHEYWGPEIARAEERFAHWVLWHARLARYLGLATIGLALSLEPFLLVFAHENVRWSRNHSLPLLVAVFALVVPAILLFAVAKRLLPKYRGVVHNLAALLAVEAGYSLLALACLS